MGNGEWNLRRRAACKAPTAGGKGFDNNLLAKLLELSLCLG